MCDRYRLPQIINDLKLLFPVLYLIDTKRYLVRTNVYRAIRLHLHRI